MENPIMTLTMADGGKIVCELYPDKAPQSVRNMISLANKGFYDGLIFHRVISGFMIQGGCPKGTGTGGGVCQVSSTLYAAMVYAGLPATERHAHSLPVDYLPAGLDATIAGSYLDLKFTNTFSQPLLIQASANGGTLTVTLVLQ